MGMAWARARLRPETTDRLIAASLAGWALFDVPWWWRPPGHGGSLLAEAGITGLAAAQSLPFLWRRRWPALVLAITAAPLAVKIAAQLNLWSAGAAVLTAAYGIGAYGGTAVRKAARVGVAVAILAVIVSLQAFDGNHVAAIGWALLGTALALGEVTATHADLVASAAMRVHEQERASLAREIHDVVAHQLSAIAVQAGAARFAAADDAQAAVRAVAVIEQNARGGLAELNTLVRQLRRVDQPDDGDDRTPRQPRLDDVPGLVTRATQSGLRAELLIDGRPRPLPDAVELAGYRVVQEGLTNAIRHAVGTAATVTLRYGDDGLVVEVADDGPVELGTAETSTAETSTAEPSTAEPSTVSRSGGGAGLAGLGERVRLLGGDLEAGRRHLGFVVRAFLPSHR